MLTLSKQFIPILAPSLAGCGLVAALCVSGCDLQFGWGDPCEKDGQGNFINPAFPGLTDAEQTACSDCGYIDCESDTGEAGDPDDIACDGKYQPDGDQVICVEGDGYVAQLAGTNRRSRPSASTPARRLRLPAGRRRCLRRPGRRRNLCLRPCWVRSLGR